VSDPAVLRTLLAWKSAQYQRGQLVDVFSFPWTAELLERIRACQTPTFAGLLSALYFGDTLAGVHFGMRSASVWNWWFPRHELNFDRYSPGILLRWAAAEAAPALGIRRIDLGLGGEETYKPRLRTGGIPLAVGTIERPALVNAARRMGQRLERWGRASPLLPVLRMPGRIIKGITRRGRFA
jgi:CelD/BcsL family acetyltransferase involved in cellulose biosynthesis